MRVCRDDRGLRSLCRMRCLQNTFLSLSPSLCLPHTHYTPPSLRARCVARSPGLLGRRYLPFICSTRSDKAASLTEFLISRGKETSWCNFLFIWRVCHSRSCFFLSPLCACACTHNSDAALPVRVHNSMQAPPFFLFPPAPVIVRQTRFSRSVSLSLSLPANQVKN